MARAAGNQNEGCFSDLLCTLASFSSLSLRSPCLSLGGSWLRVGLVTGNSGLVGTGLALIGAGVVIGVAGVAVAIGLITVWIPETENHILMIESTRFLSNNLKLRDYRCSDPSLAAYVCDPGEQQQSGGCSAAL